MRVISSLATFDVVFAATLIILGELVQLAREQHWINRHDHCAITNIGLMSTTLAQDDQL